MTPPDLSRAEAERERLWKEFCRKVQARYVVTSSTEPVDREGRDALAEIVQQERERAAAEEAGVRDSMWCASIISVLGMGTPMDDLCRDFNENRDKYERLARNLRGLPLRARPSAPAPVKEDPA